MNLIFFIAHPPRKHKNKPSRLGFYINLVEFTIGLLKITYIYASIRTWVADNWTQGVGSECSSTGRSLNFIHTLFGM